MLGERLLKAIVPTKPVTRCEWPLIAAFPASRWVMKPGGGGHEVYERWVELLDRPEVRAS